MIEEFFKDFLIKFLSSFFTDYLSKINNPKLEKFISYTALSMGITLIGIWLFYIFRKTYHGLKAVYIKYKRKYNLKKSKKKYRVTSKEIFSQNISKISEGDDELADYFFNKYEVYNNPKILLNIFGLKIDDMLKRKLAKRLSILNPNDQAFEYIVIILYKSIK